MKIINKEQFNEFPNGTIFKLFLSGVDWDEDFGISPWAIKKNNKLYTIKLNDWFDFNECIIDDEFSVEVFYNGDKDK